MQSVRLWSDAQQLVPDQLVLRLPQFHSVCVFVGLLSKAPHLMDCEALKLLSQSHSFTERILEVNREGGGKDHGE